MATSAGGLLRTAAAHHYVEHFPQTTVDAAVSAQYSGRAPDLLKLDVQGYELWVLKGFENRCPAFA